MAGVIRAVQFALLDEFDLDDERRAFAERYVAAGCVNQVQALREVRGEGCSDGYLKKRACLLLQEDEVRRYVEHLRTKAALSAALDASEVIAGLRRVYMMGLGDLPRVETVTPKDADGNELDPVVVPFVKQDLGSATRALELLGRTITLFKDRQELTGEDGGPVDTKWTIEVVGANAPHANT